MAAGLNGGRHKSQHRIELKHTHIILAVLIRHSLKYKNTVSQKTFYRDTKLQMSSKISKGGKEARLKEEGGGGRRGGQKVALQTSPATYRHPGLREFSLGFQKRETRDNAGTHTNTESRRQTPGQTTVGRQHSAGFSGPLNFIAPGTRFTLPNDVHCSPNSGSGEELSFPRSRLPSSALAGLGLASAGTSSPFPLYRKLSPAPDTFLLLSRASDLHWTFLSCLSTSAIIYPSPLSWKCSLSLVKGSRTSSQMLYPMSESPSGKREGSKTMQLAKREVYC